MTNQTTIKGIPVFAAVLTDEEDGMYRVSLVDEPAVLKDFQAFDETKPMQKFAVMDEEKRIIYGCLMRADYPIYRESKSIGSFFITFSADTLRTMAEKYLAEGRQNNVNIMHEDGSDVEGVQMVQLFIKDSAHGINPEGFDDIEEGSLFAQYHVTNDEVWESVKSGDFKGFSIESIFSLAPVTEEVDEQKVIEGNSWLNSFTKSMNKKAKTLFSKILAAVCSVGNFGAISTDKAILYWDGEEDLKAGDAVYVEDDDGNRTAAEDGDYATDDNKIIRVKDGKVEEITDKEAEVADDEETPAEESNFRKMAAKMESTFDDIYNAIYAALAAAGIDGWIAEASMEYCVVEVYTSEGHKYNRYPIAVAEDGTVTLGDGEEVKPAFIPVDEEPAEPAATPVEETEEFKALKMQFNALKAENDALKNKPAASPAHEDFKSMAEAPKTGSKRLDNFLAICAAQQK